MKTYNYITYIFLALIMCACANKDFPLSDNGNHTNVTFRPTIDQAMDTRSIGDASNINQLIVNVYEGTTTLSKVLSYTEDWSIAQRNGITLSLIEGHTYHILFWAHDAENTAYTLLNDGNIAINYTDYTNEGFTKMEELDAFYSTSTITVGKNETLAVSLSRPLAQLNFADNVTKPEQKIHQAIVTLYGIPNSFNPFTSEMTTKEEGTIFTFSDFPTETLNVDETSYYYVASNYIFVPSKNNIHITATLDIQSTDGTSINKFEFKDNNSILLERNKKTNVLGSIVQQPETCSVWNGIIPTEHTLTTDSENRYIIDEAIDIAWLNIYGSTLDTHKTFIQTIDIDMNNLEISSMIMPNGSMYNGNGHSIKNYKNSLFGDATNLSVQHLIIDNATIIDGATHSGILINILNGSGNFEEVHVTNSSVTTTNGAAGGMIGYIKKNENETLEVSFNKCNVTSCRINGSLTSGIYVGRFHGYDKNEKLSFNANCESSSTTLENKNAYYTTAHTASWFTPNQITSFAKYSGWLGDEEFNRGSIWYGVERYIPCWDGIKTVEPLTEGKTKLIYSPFDLASLQDDEFDAVTFKEDIDLGGNRETKRNPFTPIKSITILDGENHTLHNLYVEVTASSGGFISNANGGTHKNLTFNNSSVIVHYITEEDENGNPKQDLGYAGTLCPYIKSGEYTADNIHVTNGYVFGLGKIGGLIGFIPQNDSATKTIKNSSVSYSTIKNEKGKTQENFHGIAKFYAQGEAGGFIGMIMNNTHIENCSVTHSTMDCYGEEDQWIIIAKIPGRHVNHFIGDIRTPKGQTITITSCSASNNNYITSEGKRKDEPFKFNKKETNLIGSAYALNILYVIQIDEKGKVKIDGIDFL